MPEEQYKPNDLMKFFAWQHLPEHLQPISRAYHATAAWTDENLPNGAEKTTALRKLLEAKDCAVRAALDMPRTESAAA